MRIVQIMLGKEFGGAERSFIDLCAALSMRGHEVLAICESRAQARAYVERIDGITVRPIKVFGPWDYWAALQLKSHIKAFKPSIVQAHLARAAKLGGWAARSLSIPSVAKTHNYVNLKYYRRINHLVPTTDKQRKYLLANGVTEDKISQIANFSSIAPMPRAQAQAGDPLRVVALGRLVHKKGFDVLLRAVAAAVQSGADIRLEIAGDGPELTVLKNQVAELDLVSKVTFLGWQASPESVLARADVFVLPSRDEPFGIVCLEAMALGVSIIATRTDGPAEILDGDTALLVDIEDVSGLAQALVEIASDPAKAAARAAAARDKFNASYSEEIVLQQYLELYRRLVC
ncbi:MAG: glycosyltransferase involved in cell wall biosynthesis [Gammaproteobacteria bacterium]|jgi:glycosyltransferase involved in cell wall biosynthesis